MRLARSCSFKAPYGIVWRSLSREGARTNRRNPVANPPQMAYSVVPMRLALYQPDIPQNTGAISASRLPLARESCCTVPRKLGWLMPEPM